MEFTPAGVIPAVLLPFDHDETINQSAYREHLRSVVKSAPVSAVTVNGHSQEIDTLSWSEQAQVLEITVEEVGDHLPIVAGIYHDGSTRAAEIARFAQDLGASALLVFPPHGLVQGGQLKPDMAYAHFERIAAASDLPIIAFQYAMSSGQGYPLDTLVELCERVPSIVAIKDWCNDVPRHERHIRTLHSLDRRIAVLTTHSAWLLSSLVLGCDGLLSGAGSVIASLQHELFTAVQEHDLKRAQEINDRIHPIASAFYADPFNDMHNRMKESLVLLGQLEHAVVRPPLTKLSSDEIAELATALRLGGLLAE